MTKKLCLLIASFVALNTFSAEYEYAWRNSVSNSSNITQLPSGDAGNIYTSGLFFTTESEGYQEWEFNLSGDMSHIWYTAPDIEDEDRISLSSNANFDSSSSNFSLNLLADLRQAPTNRFQTQDVNNLRDNRLLGVAPNYFFNLTPTTRLNINYQHADYQVETDSQLNTLQNTPRIEQQGTISLNTQINATNRLAIVGRKKDTDFDSESDEIGIDYLQYDILGRWIVNNRVNQIVTEAGRFRVKSFRGEMAEESQWRFLLTRQINRNQSLNIQLSKSVASLFTINQATGNITVNQQNNAITDAQVSKGGGVQYNYSTELISVTLGFLETELSGLFDPSFEIRRSKSIRTTYSLSKLLNTPLERQVTLFLSSNENDFDLEITNTTESLIKAQVFSYSHSTSRNLSWFFNYSKRDTYRRFIDLPQESTTSETYSVGFEYRNNGRW